MLCFAWTAKINSCEMAENLTAKINSRENLGTVAQNFFLADCHCSAIPPGDFIALFPYLFCIALFPARQNTRYPDPYTRQANSCILNEPQLILCMEDKGISARILIALRECNRYARLLNRGWILVLNKWKLCIPIAAFLLNLWLWNLVWERTEHICTQQCLIKCWDTVPLIETLRILVSTIREDLHFVNWIQRYRPLPRFNRMDKEPRHSIEDAIHPWLPQSSYTQRNDQPISALTFRALEWFSGRAVALCTQGRGFESHRLQLVSAKSLKAKTVYNLDAKNKMEGT